MRGFQINKSKKIITYYTQDINSADFITKRTINRPFCKTVNIRKCVVHRSRLRDKCENFQPPLRKIVAERRVRDIYLRFLVVSRILSSFSHSFFPRSLFAALFYTAAVYMFCGKRALFPFRSFFAKQIIHTTYVYV